MSPSDIPKKQLALNATITKLTKLLEEAIDSEDMSMVVQASIINYNLKILTAKIDKEIVMLDLCMEKN